MALSLVVAVLLLVSGVLLVFNEVRAAHRAGRPMRRGFVALCVLVVVLGTTSAVLTVLAG